MGTKAEAPTTPPSVVSQLIPDSTPHSRGTAAVAATLVDERAGNYKNMQNVAYDLQTRECCSFITMLKALMLRRVMMKDGSRKDFSPTQEEWTNVDRVFKTYLQGAVGFVNSGKAESVRASLRKYCDTPLERDRYPHIVGILNGILHYFRTREEGVENGDVIFTINDPVVIESKHLPESTKRKPDLICLLTERFKGLHENCEDYNFEACLVIAPKVNPKAKSNKVPKTTWGDILQSWELEAKGEIKLEIPEIFEVEGFLGRNEGLMSAPPNPPVPSTSRASAVPSNAPPVASTSRASTSPSNMPPVASASRTSSNSKRKRVSENILSSTRTSKKNKTDQLTPLTPKASKDMQCAFYGIERLRHSIDITHSTVVLLSDADLTFFWYDSQGCIAADSINIVTQLPLLVVMIRILGAFPLGMWGYTPVSIWTESNGERLPYERKENPVGSFQIIGRRTFTADASREKPPYIQTASTSTTVPILRRSMRNKAGPQLQPSSLTDVHPHEDVSADERLQDVQSDTQPQPSSSNDAHSHEYAPADKQLQDVLFLKSAWPETTRRKEPEVIMEAYKRAKELLGTEAPSVTKHLPVLINFQELAYTSTKIIRCLVKSTTKLGFRVQLWMLSKKLKAIHTLNPMDFWKAFWQTLRCHALLWRIGIAHGDVSLYNLMYKEDDKCGVLNDFDLSTIMKAGDKHPDRQGLERTGTLPFMALELLDNRGFDGKIPRRYDHELESFAWVLVWTSRCVIHGEERERPSRLKKWLSNNNEEVYESKSSFAGWQHLIATTPDYLWLESALTNWIYALVTSHLLRFQHRVPVAEKTNSEHLQSFISTCQEFVNEDARVSVPINVTWVNSLADLKFTTPDISHLSLPAS